MGEIYATLEMAFLRSAQISTTFMTQSHKMTNDYIKVSAQKLLPNVKIHITNQGKSFKDMTKS